MYIDAVTQVIWAVSQFQNNKTLWFQYFIVKVLSAALWVGTTKIVFTKFEFQLVEYDEDFLLTNLRINEKYY